jgi:hypothetical protein
MITILVPPERSHERTTTTPDSLRPFQSGDTIIHDPSQLQYEEMSIRSPHLHQYDEISTHGLPLVQRDETSILSLSKSQYDKRSIRSLNNHQFKERFTRILPLPQPETIILKVPGCSQEPSQNSPLAITLARNPFVVKRRNPFAINLNPNKVFVTKRRPLLSFKRPHLFVERRKTKNPFALAKFRKKTQSRGISVEMPVVARKQKFLRFGKRKGVRQRESKSRVQKGENQVQAQKTMAVSDRRWPFRLSLKGRRAKREKQPGDQAPEAANRGSRKQKQRSARKKKFLGMSIPSLRRRVKEMTTTAEVSTVLAARRMNQPLQTLEVQESIKLVSHVQEPEPQPVQSLRDRSSRTLAEEDIRRKKRERSARENDSHPSAYETENHRGESPTITNGLHIRPPTFVQRARKTGTQDVGSEIANRTPTPTPLANVGGKGGPDPEIARARERRQRDRELQDRNRKRQSIQREKTTTPPTAVPQSQRHIQYRDVPPRRSSQDTLLIQIERARPSPGQH